MKVEITNPNTKETKIVEMDEMSFDSFKELNTERMSDNVIDREINELPLNHYTSNPQQAKVYLDMIKNYSVKVGDIVLKVGRKIIELIILLHKNYPKTAMGLIVGAVAGLIFSSIPVLGWALGWLVGPLCTLFCLAVGFWMDMNDTMIKNKIEAAIKDTFNVLKDIPNAA